MRIERVWDLKTESYWWKVTVNRPYPRASYHSKKWYKAVLRALRACLRGKSRSQVEKVPKSKDRPEKKAKLCPHCKGKMNYGGLYEYSGNPTTEYWSCPKCNRFYFLDRE